MLVAETTGRTVSLARYHQRRSIEEKAIVSFEW